MSAAYSIAITAHDLALDDIEQMAGAANKIHCAICAAGFGCGHDQLDWNCGKISELGLHSGDAEADIDSCKAREQPPESA